MSTVARHQLVVFAAAVCVFFTLLGRPSLWDEDEPKNAACAHEMLEAGDWITPRFNFEDRCVGYPRADWVRGLT